MPIEDVVARQQQMIARREALIAKTMLSDYQSIANTLDEANLYFLQDPSRGSAYQRARINELSRQANTALKSLTNNANANLQDEIRVEILNGISHAEEQSEFLGAVRLNTQGVREITERQVAQAGYFADLPSQTSARLREALNTGLALGKNPVIVARELKQTLGWSSNRALTTARTEMMDAYRTAQLGTYKKNKDILRGWIWIAARQTRTCPLCWAMHGSKHDFDEKFESHPRCRCSAAPDVSGLRVKSGQTEFNKLSAEAQRAILGNKKYALYKARKLKLTDFVGHKVGMYRFEKTLSQLAWENQPRAKQTDILTSTLIKRKPLEAEKEIRRIEAQFRNDLKEHGMIFDRDGNILRIIDGDYTSTTLMGRDMSLMRDGIFSHNHPNSSGFSLADLESTTGFTGDVWQLRAVTPDGHLMTLTRPDKGWPITLDRTASMIDTEIHNKYAPLYARTISYIERNKLDIRMSKEIIQEISRQTGIKYTDKKIWAKDAEVFENWYVAFMNAPMPIRRIA